MKKTVMIVWFCINVITLNGFAQTIPEPQPKLCCGTWDDHGNCIGTLMTPEEYSKHCKASRSGGMPSAPGGLSPSQQVQLQMFKTILQPIFNSIFSSIFSSISATPPKSHQENITKQLQQEERKREEENRKATEAWQKHLEEAEKQAKLEIENKKAAGQNILSRVQISKGLFGSYTVIGPKMPENQTSLSKIDWDNPRGGRVPQVNTESAKEHLLMVAYFSKMAETAMLNGDFEAARFWAGIAFEDPTNSPRVIEYKPPKELIDSMDTSKAIEMNKKLAQYSSFFREALPKLDLLQDVFMKIEEINIKKEDALKKKKEVEEEIKRLEIKKQTAQTPEEKSSTNDLLAKAIALKEQVEAEYQKTLQEEQKIIQEKKNLEKELNEMRNKLKVETK